VRSHGSTHWRSIPKDTLSRPSQVHCIIGEKKPVPKRRDRSCLKPTPLSFVMMAAVVFAIMVMMFVGVAVTMSVAMTVMVMVAMPVTMSLAVTMIVVPNLLD